VLSGFKADIWASGVTLYLLATGKTPFQADNILEIYDKIAKAKFEIPSFIEPSLATLIRGMMESNENERYSIQQIKSSEWFTTNIYQHIPRVNLTELSKNIVIKSKIVENFVNAMDETSETQRN
jgi:serine/threonine protein kinase